MQGYLEAQATRFVSAFDANCYLYLSRAMDRFDLNVHGKLSLEDAQNELFVLFVTLAQLGAHDDQSARIAYEAGMSSLFPMRRPQYQHMNDWPERLSAALPRLESLHPFAKKAVIEALVKAIVSDDVMTVEESELLRAVCALMHCPLPMLVAFGQPETGALTDGDEPATNG